MRQRITYIRNASRDDNFTPENIQVSGNSLNVRQLSGAKEHRLTTGLSELPDAITSALNQCHELHIRWSSPRLLPLPLPFSSRVPPGLHVSLTPQEQNDVGLICPMLQDVFSEDIRCHSHRESFTTPQILSERFSTTASSQFYSYVSSLAEFVLFVQEQICPASDLMCQDTSFSLLSASSLDIDYDVISRVLVIAAYWGQGQEENGLWNDRISKTSDDDKIEIGILNEEKATEAEELSLGGWLTVLGDDTKPKPTLFSFPSRHHILPSNTTHPCPTFDAAFDKPTGLHPTLRINLHRKEQLTPPAASCALHTYLTLPSTLFLDRHAFSDPLFLSSHNIASLRAISGATDLEAPAWAISEWGSAILIELSVPPPSTPAYPHTHAVTIPLHARYMAPAPGGQRTVATPWPAVFWACAADEGAKFPVNPFDRRELGFDGLFGDRTLFYHLLPRPVERGVGLGGDELGEAEELVSMLSLPVLDANWSRYVEVGTVVAVVVGFLWVCWALFGPVGSSRAAAVPGAAAKDGKGKTKRNA